MYLYLLGAKYFTYNSLGRMLYVDECEFNKLSLIFNRSSTAKIRIDKNFSISDNIYVMSCDDEILIKYTYYFIVNNLKILSEIYEGGFIKNLTKKSLSDIKIRVPDSKRQKEIVEQIGGWDELIQRERKIVSNIESLVMRFINFKALEYEKIRLSEILDRIKGKKHLASEGKDEGEYPFIVSSNIKKKFCDSYDYEDHCLIVGNGGIPNIHFEEKFSISSHMLLFKAKENFIIDFVYYLKANMRIIENGFNGTTIKNINLSNFLNIEIPNFPLEKQKLLSHSFEILRAKKGNIKGYQKMLNMLIDEMIPKI